MNPRPAARPKLFRLLLRAVVVLCLSTPFIILFLSIETTPRLTANQQLSRAELSRIETLLLETSPQITSDASLQELKLNTEELNLLLRYAVNILNLPIEWAARTELSEKNLNSELSVRVTESPLPLYLNIEADFVENNELLSLNELRIGRIGIPDALVQFGYEQLQRRLASGSPSSLDFDDLLSNIERVELAQNQMSVTMQWDPDLVSRIGDQAQQFFISEQDQQRIVDYYGVIRNVAAAIPTDIRSVSLNTFLTPVFARAYAKSQAGSDPIAENRTAFQTLATYLNQESIEQLIGEEAAVNVEPAKYVAARLLRREDLALHLVSIAAITASAGEDLAQMVSTTKEAYDARYSSGFSFSDLTANSVGVTMARLSTADIETAKTMQFRLANLQNETEYMPEGGNNRDGLSETDFNAIYTDRNSAEYQARLAEIQMLIEMRPLFYGLLD